MVPAFFGLCLCCARVSVAPDPAPHDVDQAAEDARGVRRAARPHRRFQGDEGCRGPGRGDRRLESREVLHAPTVQEPGEPGDPLPDHRPRDLERHAGQDRHLRLRRGDGWHDDRRQPLHQIAQHLKGHSRVSWVRYPGLPDDPAHATASRYLSRGFGGMVVFGIQGGYGAAVKLIDNIKLFFHLANVGDAKSRSFTRRARRTASSAKSSSARAA